MKLMVYRERKDVKFYEFVFIEDMATAYHENPRDRFPLHTFMIPKSPFDGFRIAES